MSPLTLKIVTPEGDDRSIGCDSVNLWMAPEGHVDAVIALGNGPLEAHLEGKTVFSARTEGGFVTVLHDTVTVITNHLHL